MAQLMLTVPLVVEGNRRQRPVAATTVDASWDQNEIFEIDRSDVVLQLRSLRRAIDQGAEEMEMVSAERVFSKPLSRTLICGARQLRTVSRSLNRVVRLLERAQVSKANRRPEPKPKPRKRRKVRN